MFQFYQKGKIDCSHKTIAIVVFLYFEKLYFLCFQLFVENFFLQLNWSCWSALTSLRTCFVAGALRSLSVTLCQYQNTQRGAVDNRNKVISVLSIVTNLNLSFSFIHHV